MAKPFQNFSFLLGHHSVRNGLYLPNLANITTHSIIGLLLRHNYHLSQLSDIVTTVFLGHVLPTFHVYDDFSVGAFTVFIFQSFYLVYCLSLCISFFLSICPKFVGLYVCRGVESQPRCALALGLSTQTWAPD